MKQSGFLTSADIIYRSDKLIRTASNRYLITNEVAKRAKRRRYEDFDAIDNPMMKPVIRAIIEMSDELDSPDILVDKGEKSSSQSQSSSSQSSQSQSSSSQSSSSQSSSSQSSSSQSSSSQSQSSSFNAVINGVNKEVNNNDDLSHFKEKSNFEAWNDVITWITEWFAGPESAWDFSSARKSVERLQTRLKYLPVREIAHILVLQKMIQTAGINILNSIPCAEDIISAIADYDLPNLAKISIEMLYQIGIIYGRPDPKTSVDIIKREVEILSIFGSAFCIDKAIDNGLGFLKLGWLERTAIKASVKALFIYYLGRAACEYYEDYEPQRALSQVINRNKTYLDNFIDNQGISDRLISGYITDDLEETLVRYSVYEDYEDPSNTIANYGAFDSKCVELGQLLRARQWQKADALTFELLLLIGDSEQKSYLSKSEVKTLPCKQLHQIDDLWRNNSDGKFGFSVQTEIYKKLGGTEQYDLEKWRKFGNILGWRKKERWLSYQDMMKSLDFDSLPKGHLPARGVGGLKYVGSYRLIYTRFEQCSKE